MIRFPRLEFSTTGFDPALQGVGSDPTNSSSSLGLVVPTAPTTAANLRYMFLLAFYRIGAHRKVRLVGMRQLLTIAATVSSGGEGPAVCNYVLEKEVVSPIFRFQDGNVSWHLRRIPPGNQNAFSKLNATSQRFVSSLDPALLFKVPPSGGYKPPFSGRIPGKALTPTWGTFYDVRFPWSSDHAQDALNIEIEGPCDIAFFASVRQTDPNERCELVVPATLPAGSGCIPEDDAFVANFTGVRYYRIAGSLIFEKENFYSQPRDYIEDAPGEWFPPTNTGQGEQDGRLVQPGRGPTLPKAKRLKK